MLTTLCLCAASFLAGMLTIAWVNRWGRSVAQRDIREHEAANPKPGQIWRNRVALEGDPFPAKAVIYVKVLDSLDGCVRYAMGSSQGTFHNTFDEIFQDNRMELAKFVRIYEPCLDIGWDYGKPMHKSNNFEYYGEIGADDPNSNHPNQPKAAQ